MFVDPRSEVVRISPEGDTEQFQELVHAVEQRLRRVRRRGGGGRALEHDHAVRQIRRHDEIVLYYEACAFCVENEPVGEGLVFRNRIFILNIQYVEQIEVQYKLLHLDISTGIH